MIYRVFHKFWGATKLLFLHIENIVWPLCFYISLNYSSRALESQVRKLDIKISNRFLSDRIRSYNNIVCDHTGSYKKAYEKSLSQIFYINSYTKSRIWPNNTILHDHIRSYNKILINLFTVIPIFECCYIEYRSNRLRKN